MLFINIFLFFSSRVLSILKFNSYIYSLLTFYIIWNKISAFKLNLIKFKRYN